jgi:uncharacterized protein
MSSQRGPTPPSERIVALDALRGVAILGILVINVRLFSMPEVSLLNPTAYGDFSGLNYWAWAAGHVLAEQKFLTLFTVLFGASVMLFTRSLDRRGASGLDLFFKRSGWLVIFGLAHAYLLWYGDILVAYGVTAFVVVFFRNRGPRVLTLLGLALLLFPSAVEVSAVLSGDIASFAAAWRPPQAAISAEIEAYTGGWLSQLDHRVPAAFYRQTTGFLSATFWRVSGSMLLGMALFKWGVLTNDRSTRFYRRLFALGASTGLAVTVAGVWYIQAREWTASAGLVWQQFNYWGSFALAGAYIAVVMLYSRWRPEGVVTRTLAAIGRTAFSNYILQTVLATSFFYGHGLGLFGQVTRFEALAVVVAIWAVQVVASVLWLRYFRFGPLEWLWRSLTYGRVPPLRIDRETS